MFSYLLTHVLLLFIFRTCSSFCSPLSFSIPHILSSSAPVTSILLCRLLYLTPVFFLVLLLAPPLIPFCLFFPSHFFLLSIHYCSSGLSSHHLSSSILSTLSFPPLNLLVFSAPSLSLSSSPLREQEEDLSDRPSPPCALTRLHCVTGKGWAVPRFI